MLTGEPTNSSKPSKPDSALNEAKTRRRKFKLLNCAVEPARQHLRPLPDYQNNFIVRRLGAAVTRDMVSVFVIY